jgi:hypothetical protein
MLLTILTVRTTEFYQNFDQVGFFLSRFFIFLFAAMLLYSALKYAKR